MADCHWILHLYHVSGIQCAAVPEEHCGAPVPLRSAWTPLRPLCLFRVELHQGALLVLQVQGAVGGHRPLDCLRPS